MEEIVLKNKNIPEQLRIFWYKPEKSSDTAAIFIGGYGDRGSQFEEIARSLLKDGFPYNIVSFSFRGVEIGEDLSLNQQVTDLEEIINYLVSVKRIRSIKLISTSDGAYSTVFAVTKSPHRKLITDVLMLDPADYYLDQGDDKKISFLWSGYAAYNPVKPTLISLLKRLNSKVRIHIVHFLVRNYSKEGYIEKEYKKRDQNNIHGYPRLNSVMVKALYNNIPPKNKGEYIEAATLPHAFFRDGDLQQNRKRVVELIEKYIG